MVTHIQIETTKTRNNDGEQSKQWNQDVENTKVPWWKVDCTMLKSQNNEAMMVKTRYNFVFSPMYFRTFTNVVSLFRHFEFSPSCYGLSLSCYCVFTIIVSLFRLFIMIVLCAIVLSTFHYHTIVFSSPYLRVFNGIFYKWL